MVPAGRLQPYLAHVSLAPSPSPATWSDRHGRLLAARRRSPDLRKPILSGGCVRTCYAATQGRAALDILLASDRRPCAVATGAHSAACNARPHGHAWLRPPRDLRGARSDQAGGGSLALRARLMEDRAH